MAAMGCGNLLEFVMHAHFPPFTVTVPKPHRVVADQELGGLKHVLLQMEDEHAARVARLHEMTTEAQYRGEYNSAPGDIGN